MHHHTQSDTLKYIFRSYDGDADGKLEAREFYLVNAPSSFALSHDYMQFLFELGKKHLSKAEMQACFNYILPSPQAKTLTLQEFMEGVPRLYEVEFKVPVNEKLATESLERRPSGSNAFSPEAMEIEKMVLQEKRRTIARNTGAAAEGSSSTAAQ